MTTRFLGSAQPAWPLYREDGRIVGWLLVSETDAKLLSQAADLASLVAEMLPFVGGRTAAAGSLAARARQALKAAGVAEPLVADPAKREALSEVSA